MSFVTMNHKSMNIFLYLFPPRFIWLQYKVTAKKLWDAFFHFFLFSRTRKTKIFLLVFCQIQVVCTVQFRKRKNSSRKAISFMMKMYMLEATYVWGPFLLLNEDEISLQPCHHQSIDHRMAEHRVERFLLQERKKLHLGSSSVK